MLAKSRQRSHVALALGGGDEWLSLFPVGVSALRERQSVNGLRTPDEAAAPNTGCGGFRSATWSPRIRLPLGWALRVHARARAGCALSRLGRARSRARARCLPGLAARRARVARGRG